MYFDLVNRKLISECNECQGIEHTKKCDLKLNRYLHYSGFNPLVLCYPDEEFYSEYKKNDEDSIAFASLMASAFKGIKK